MPTNKNILVSIVICVQSAKYRINVSMFTLFMVSWILKSALGNCLLNNKEMRFYGKVEDLHISNEVDGSMEEYVKNMSWDKMIFSFKFCNCKKNLDVSFFCRNILKKYYNTEVIDNEEENGMEIWKRKALVTTDDEPIKLVEDSEANSFSVFTFKVPT